jgi:hypothetical protein
MKTTFQLYRAVKGAAPLLQTGMSDVLLLH